jgi:cysteine synthase A
LTGSIRGCIKFYIIQQGYTRSLLDPGVKIIEVTCGNTGIAYSAIGCALGYLAMIFLPDWMSEERKNLNRSFRAVPLPWPARRG